MVFLFSFNGVFKLINVLNLLNMYDIYRINL